jgi:hypothetical protein
MGHKGLFLGLLGIALFAVAVGAGYLVQASLLDTPMETPTSTYPTQLTKSELVADTAVQQVQGAVESELTNLSDLDVRVVGEIGDIYTYSHAMSLESVPGDENPVWTGACRVLDEIDGKVLELYVNDEDYTQSSVGNKEEQLEKFLLSCLAAQDPEFEQLERDAAVNKLDVLYKTLQKNGIQLVSAGGAGI